MNVRQKKFADNYLKTGNAVQSALDAGYSEAYANGQSYKILENVGVKEYMDKMNEETRQESIADIVEVKEFWTDYIRDECISPSDRLRASELLARTGGAFVDRQEIKHEGKIESSTSPIEDLTTEELRKLIDMD